MAMQCGALFLALVLGYLLLHVAFYWNQLNQCKYPFGLYCIAVGCFLVLVQILSDLISDFKHFLAVRIALNFIKNVVMFFGFTIWTGIWTWIFIQSTQCLAAQHQLWFILLFLIPSHIVILITLLVLIWTLRMGIYAEIFLIGEEYDSSRVEDLEQGIASPLLDQGLDESQRKAIPSTLITEPGRKDLQLLNCAICLDGFEIGETLTKLPGCGHVFHTNHIDEWFKKSSRCPLCRSSVL